MRYIRTSNNTLIHWGIKGQRWGIRRYRNEDGTLTEAGKKRLETRKNIVDSSKRVTDSLQDVERLTRRNKKNPRLDLSNKTDKELRDEINRELLERQYNDVFNAPQTSKGRKAVETALKGASAGLGLASAGVSIALGIHTLRHG